MAPQTRSTAKPSPGRSTRNSIFGRPLPPPPKPRNSSPEKSPVRAAPAHNTELRDRVLPNTHGTSRTPWLACRDAYGIMTTVAMSETGQGTHVRWYYPEDNFEADEDGDVDVEMSANEERGVTPLATGGPSHADCHPFPQTPMALYPYDAGSVIRTPIKKARPLQRSPLRIGDKGVRCLYEQGGVLRELNGGARIILRHPVGSTANLSREQVERLEKEREERIVQIQMEKLLAEKQRIDEEERRFSDSGYEDEMETDFRPLQRSLRKEGTGDTSLVSQSELSDSLPPVPQGVDREPGLFRGPNGELLDHKGCQALGPEGTILIDSTYAFPKRIKREDAFVELMESADHPNQDQCAGEAEGLRQARFGREGTELID